MARVTGPLHSDDASGSIKGGVTYAKWKGRNYARATVTPKNPKSAKQIGVRAMLGFVAEAWNALATLTKATWDTLAEAQSISAFNAYVQANLNRWQNFMGPTQANPAAEASAALTVSAHTYTGGVGQANLSLTASGATAIWGIAILRSLAEITAPDWTQCIAIIPVTTAGPHTYVDSPLPAETYHYRAVVINTDGKMGTVLADDTCEVT